MTDEIKDEELEETADVKTEEVDPSKKDVKTDTTEEVETDEAEETEEEDTKNVPYKRFKEINDKYKEVKAELDALKNGSLQKDEAETETTGIVDETEEVDTESTNPLQSKLSEYEEVFNQMFESKMQQVPQEFHDLIPEGDDLQKMAWIDNAINKGLFGSTKDVKDFGNLGSNPAEEEQPDNSSFIRNLGRKF